MIHTPLQKDDADKNRIQKKQLELIVKNKNHENAPSDTCCVVQIFHTFRMLTRPQKTEPSKIYIAQALFERTFYTPPPPPKKRENSDARIILDNYRVFKAH